MSWLVRHAPAIQSLAALVTMIVAVLALLGVKLQIDANAQIQAHQSARAIYRGFLEISIANPDLTQPDACAGTTRAQSPSYDAYLDHLLYTSEQVISIHPDWGPVMEHWLNRHAHELCQMDDFDTVTTDMADLITGIQNDICPAPLNCP